LYYFEERLASVIIVASKSKLFRHKDMRNNSQSLGNRCRRWAVVFAAFMVFTIPRLKSPAFAPGIAERNMTTTFPPKNLSKVCTANIYDNTNETRNCIKNLLDYIDASNACDSSQVEEFSLDSAWENYSFADSIKGRCCPDPEKEPTSLRTEYGRIAIREHPDPKSKCGYQSRDLSIISRLIKQRINNVTKSSTNPNATNIIPAANSLIIHVRVGDVIDWSLDSVEDLLLEPKYYFRSVNGRKCCLNPFQHPTKPILKESWNLYVKPLSYFAHVARTTLTQDLQQNAPKTIVLMGAAHMVGLFSPIKKAVAT